MRFWRGQRNNGRDDGLDLVLAELLATRRFEGELDQFHLARARARVDSRLREPGTSSRWLRRLAAGGLGGTSMWVGLVGAAAAHKAAAAAVGLSILVGGTVAVETGVGPAVRDQVQNALGVSGEERSSNEHAPTASTSTSVAATASAASAAGGVNGATVEPADGVPGNLVAHVAPSGSFQLRGVIVAGDKDTLTVTTAEGELDIDISEARVVWMGKTGDDVVRDELTGYLVVISGSCEGHDSAATLSDCDSLTATHVQVLGRAGQQANGPVQTGKPDSADARGAAGREDGAASQAGSERARGGEGSQPQATPTQAAPTPRRGTPRD